MLIAQISDLHLGFDGDEEDERNLRRFRAVLDALTGLDPRPDLLIVSGDLTEHGSPASYDRVAAELARLPMPVAVAAGNHDRRAALLAAFPDLGTADGFIQYRLPVAAGQVIVLDTLEEGRGGGAFCETRAAWLADVLARSPEVPTLVVLHHPPFAIGIDWMDPDAAAPWIERLRTAIEPAHQVVGMIMGHVHRPATACWAGKTCVVASSVAPQLALDTRPTAGVAPDGRAIIVEEEPGYVLHRWRPEGLVSLYARAAPAAVLARFDPGTADMLAELNAEGFGP